MKSIYIICFFFICGFSVVSSFSWSICSSKPETIKISSLDISFNGTQMLYVTGRGKVGMNITGPIQANVTMWKKFFWGWSEIPCLDQVGSCAYENICTLSPYIEKPCPEEFVTNDVPCKCPILQKQYTVKKMGIDLSILPHWIEQGKYKIKLRLMEKKTEILCLLLDISL